jgi:serine kinase of HPr protein (carbohydrate metabolism regulator)
VTIPSSEMLHASTVAIDGQAILITGVSGSGKSDLALRLIDRGATLVSDDYTLLTRAGTELRASSPATTKGKLEVRGIGIVDCEALDSAPAALIVRIDAVPLRMPEDDLQNVIGVEVPVIALAPFEASAPIKVELALRRLAAR